MPQEANRSSGNVALLREKAQQNCRERRCEEAIGLFEEALRQQPADAALHYQLGLCHSGACQRHSLISADIALEYLRHAFLLLGSAPGRDAWLEPDEQPSSKSLLRAKILDALGNTLVESRQGLSAERLRQSISFHREASRIYLRLGLVEDWAREEFNQANMWCDLAESNEPGGWVEAVRHYEHALRVRTKTKDPRGYAATLMNLGTALRQSPSGDYVRNVLKAARCYREALRIFTKETSPSQYAHACNNLGNAFLSYTARSDAARKRHARSALRYFERALNSPAAEDQRCHAARVQYNRGCAYLRLADSLKTLEQAVGCFSDARERSLSGGCPEIADLSRSQLLKIAFPIG